MNEIAVMDAKNLNDRIYMIRGQKVMLDLDLAEIYGYTTKAFNQQVKNNDCKFDDDFRFRITKNEAMNLRSKILTSRKNSLFAGQSGGSRYLPYAFTEQGIYMLMTVLKGPLAVQQNKALIRMFKDMKDCISANKGFIGTDEFMMLSNRVDCNARNTEIRLEKVETEIKQSNQELKKVMDNFIDPNTYKHYLILDGEKIEADIAYRSIYKTAQQTVYIIDNYIGLKTLHHLKSVKENVSVIIFSDNSKSKDMLTLIMVNDFKNDCPKIPITFKETNGRYRDRYIVIDYGCANEAVYHCGASSKDAGRKISTITRAEDKELYHPIVDELLSGPTAII